ncbi:MAG TPA: PEP-CTERM sorting domain-containing protein [Phycisphaerae bacterium]|nr:PEP-CTERM sorting domain-containing protein [Phycisphaerae bacterium]
MSAIRVSFIFLLIGAQSILGQVGEPTGMTVTIKQGGTTIASHAVTLGPGGDLPDIKISDGNPESHTQIGTVGAGNPMIMKVVTDDDPLYRILHMYIDVPISNSDIDHPGPTSLFDPSNPALISVEVTNVTFNNNANALPQLDNSNSFYTEFMRDYDGHFYELPGANAYNSLGHGIYDIQVPGNKFLDGDLTHYTFDSTPGTVSNWAWQNIVNPGPSTTIHNGFQGGLPSSGGGYVFELGLAVAFTAVPEPATIFFVGAGAFGFFASMRRKARIRRLRERHS